MADAWGDGTARSIAITGGTTADCPRHGGMTESSGSIRREPYDHSHVLEDGYSMVIPG